MSKYLLLSLALITPLFLSSCNSSQANEPTSKPVSQQTNQILYVDVREDSEWAEGHIQGALHVKLGDIEAGNFTAIPKDVPINLYCRSGRRSAIATSILKNAGYTNITDVGGMDSLRGVNIVR